MIEQEVIDRLQSLLEYKHWTAYRLSKEANIPYSSLNNIFVRKTCPSVPTLDKICKGLNISLSEFFDYSINPLCSEDITKTKK